MKKLISEREINQRMIKMMSENNNDVMGGPKNEPEMSPSHSDISQDQENFRQTVAVDAKFTEFSILPDAGNVIFTGTIPGICEWRFEFTNRDGVEITIPEPITMDDEIIRLFQKMNGEFKNWRNVWGTKLIEYQNINNG